MKYHWRDWKLTDGSFAGERVPMSRHSMYNQHGLLLGKVDKQPSGVWKAYAGRPGVLLGVFDTLAEAKKAVEGTMAE